MKIDPPPSLGMGALVQPALPLGDYLQQLGHLGPEDIARIEHAQATTSGRFGEIAVRLGLVTPLQVRQALARQYAFPAADQPLRDFHPELLAVRDTEHPFSEAMRRLRAQLLLHWRARAIGTPALCVASPEQGDGRSVVAANLAISFAQANVRTLLVDLDLRSPRQHVLFGVDNRFGVSSLLIGRYAAAELPVLGGCHTLTVLPAGPTPPNPQELLNPARLASMCAGLRAMYELVIIDTPAWKRGADVQLIAAHASTAVPVVRAHRSMQRDVAELVSALQQAGAEVPAAALVHR